MEEYAPCITMPRRSSNAHNWRSFSARCQEDILRDSSTRLADVEAPRLLLCTVQSTGFRYVAVVTRDCEPPSGVKLKDLGPAVDLLQAGTIARREGVRTEKVYCECCGRLNGVVMLGGLELLKEMRRKAC